MMKIFIVIFLMASSTFAQLPAQPTDPAHPGSAAYKYSVKHENFDLNGRRVDVYLPAGAATQKFPVIVFGHGQAIDVAGYDETFNHLAKKGIAVIHPTYDSGFFDRDWRRMAADFNQMTLQKYPSLMDDKKVVYAGHSKGAYIALMAAGAPSRVVAVRSVLVFAPAGFDEEYLRNMDSKIPVTLVWSDDDSVIKQSDITTIYAKLASLNKQWILVKSYPSLQATHFFPLTKSYFFGGQNGSTSYHYFAVWKWLIGAVNDLDAARPLTDVYLYGDQANSTGVSGLNHQITRNW